MNNSEKIALIEDEHWLADYESHIVDRVNRFRSALHTIEDQSGSISEFACNHEYYGIHFDEDRNGWVYREWAPAAHQLYFFGFAALLSLALTSRGSGLET